MLGAVLSVVDKLLNYRPAGVGTFSKIGVFGKDYQSSNMLAEAHRHYTRLINFRHGWRGHLWQERFHSFPMDEKHLYEEPANSTSAAGRLRPLLW
jgi:hypothetical protein